MRPEPDREAARRIRMQSARKELRGAPLELARRNARRVLAGYDDDRIEKLREEGVV